MFQFFFSFRRSPSSKEHNFENLDLISSNVDLSGLEVETAGDNDRAFILKAKLTKSRLQTVYNIGTQLLR